MPERLNTQGDYEAGGSTPEVPTPEQEHRLGAKILAKAGFETRQKGIVDSSFDKARRNHEKLPGKNNERRNLAYLSRLGRLINKYGTRLEQKLWQASISDNLLLKEDDITEATWEAKRQEMRDEGRGNEKLTDQMKHECYEEWRELQKESLDDIANYLGDEHSPFPIWFKVYAWDGLTKMGQYDKTKGAYQTRNKTTVAPYPDADAEILAGVFDVINRYYGNDEKEFYTEEGERNIKLEQIVQSGSFPKIFNAVQQDIAPIITPPEKTEDVHGEWVEYQIGDENEIVRAASGTGWCVATPAVVRHYLLHGTYGGDDELDEYEEYEYDENDDDMKDLKSKFLLFHLTDSKTGKLAKNACASIRLNPDGRVNEISGLQKGQALDDSMVPIVEEKVRSLPGGDEFLPRFTDKQELIRLDRKMKNEEDLTKEELEFLYEIDRPIHTLDTYNRHDPRISELEKIYDINYALDHGVETDRLMSKMSPSDMAKNLDALNRHDANINVNQLVNRMKPIDIAENLDILAQHDADIDMDWLVEAMNPGDVAEKLDVLIEHKANIDINQLVREMDSHEIIENLDTLFRYHVDMKQLVSQLEPNDIAGNLDDLIHYKADINIDWLVEAMNPRGVARYLDTLIRHKADINQLVNKMYSQNIITNLDTLAKHHVDMKQLVSRLEPNHIAEKLDDLIHYKADIDIDWLVGELNKWNIAKNLDPLIRHGADVDRLVDEMFPEDVARNLDILTRHNADADKIKKVLEKIQ